MHPEANPMGHGRMLKVRHRSLFSCCTCQLALERAFIQSASCALCAGWDRGVQGMRVGDKRKLTVPPQMAYGSTGVKGTIPSNATLQFDVTLKDVK